LKSTLDDLFPLNTLASQYLVEILCY
jgi:hypothetical protein